jgi:ubiquinone/menaquinone biosynthesis C-methylase UbiE
LQQPIYETSYYQDREGWPDFRLEVETILRLARVRPGSSVLEVGCGSGELLSRLERFGGRAAGVDLSKVALRLAVQRGKRAACALAEDLPFKERSFDAIVGQHLIEHLPDPDGALLEWRRVLRPEGVLVLITPNAAYPDPSHFEDSTHIHIFTPATLRSSLEHAGFRVARLFTLFPYLGSSRLARASSIRLAPFARRLPGLSATGRSIVAAAVAPLS